MSEKELRIGVIGGWGHHSLFPAAKPELGARIVAMASDGNDDAVRKYVERGLIPDSPYFESYEKMFDEAKPDAISLGARPSMNGPVIIAALERGIHVVADKPVANTDEELRRIRELLAAGPSRLLLTEFMMRLEPAFFAMRDVVRNGGIGEVILIQAQKSYHFGTRPEWYGDRKYFPGTLAYIGSHLIDLAWWITGVNYASVSGTAGNLSKPEYGRFEDHAAALFKLANRGTAVMHMDYLRPRGAGSHGDDRMRIAGSTGVVEVRENRCTLMAGEQPPKVVAEGPYDRPAGALELLKTLRGEGRGIYSTADSLYIAELLLRAREAADSGMTIVL
jgi:predicted dehydrogenase